MKQAAGVLLGFGAVAAAVAGIVDPATAVDGVDEKNLLSDFYVRQLRHVSRQLCSGAARGSFHVQCVPGAAHRCGVLGSDPDFLRVQVTFFGETIDHKARRVYMCSMAPRMRGAECR